MKKQKKLFRFLASVLTLCLLISLAPVKALADYSSEIPVDEYKNYVRSVESNHEYIATYDGFSAMVPPKTNGLAVISIDSPHTEGIVTGVVETANTGVTVYAEGIAKTGAAAKADAIIYGINAGGTGLELEASKGGYAEGTVQNSLYADGIGVLVDANGSDANSGTLSTALAVVNQVNSDGADTIRITAENSGQAGLIGGDITATGTQTFGAWVQSSDSAGSNPAYEQTGDLKSVTYDPETGAFLVPVESKEADNSVALATAIVDGVTASAGVHVESNGATAQMQVGEEGIQVTEGNPHDRLDSFLANSVKASDRGSATLYVEGKIDSEANGVCVRTDCTSPETGGGWAVVNAKDIIAEQEGIDLDNEAGVIMVQLDSITSNLNGVDCNTGSADATNFVIVDGDVTSAEENAIHLYNYGGQAMVAVAGSARSEAEDPDIATAGLFYSGTGSDSQAIVLVVDTLSGANGVYLDDGSDYSKLDLTVWAIEAQQQDEERILEHLIAGADADAFAKTVSYIVKVEQPESGGMLCAVQQNGDALVKKFDNEGQGGFEVANEGQIVILKTDKRHVIKAAYNGPGTETKLEKDENGNYYYKVQRGGSIWLRAILELIRKGEGNAKAPAGIITLDPGDGTMNGPLVIRKAIGWKFVFSEEPVWEGHTFLYWQSTVDPNVHYYTGDQFIVHGDESFIAVWD